MDNKDSNYRQTYFAYLRAWAHTRFGMSTELPKGLDTVEQAAAAAIGVRDAKSSAIISSMAEVLKEVEHLVRRPDK